MTSPSDPLSILRSLAADPTPPPSEETISILQEKIGKANLALREPIIYLWREQGTLDQHQLLRIMRATIDLYLSTHLHAFFSLAAEENGETDNAFEAEYEATRRQLLLSLFFSNEDSSQ